jgi:probable HAF family extracellular repeat protein
MEKTLFLRSSMAFALLAAFPAAALAQAAGITNLGALNGGTMSRAQGLSSNGSVIVGGAFDGAAGNAVRAFRWTQAGGMVSLGVLNGGTGSSASAVNSDGSVIVGSVADGAAGNAFRAFRWTQAGGLVSLGTLNGGMTSSASGVNTDGSVVVGGAADGTAANANRAFRWTQAGGLVSLGTLNGGIESAASGVNSDGSVVVGTARDGAAGNENRAFRWTQAGGLVSLGTLNGGITSTASGVNSDGGVVVGTADDGAAGNAGRAFRWTQASGMVSLGALNGGNLSQANAVNADGSVVVGSANDGAAGNIERAFRWTQASGMQTVEAWLRANGVSVPTDITRVASGVNADGSVIVGELQSGFAFVARITSGLVTLQDLQSSLAGNSAAPAQAAMLGNMVLHGAHSRPLARRIASGKSCVWTAGDIGRDDHDSRDGSFWLAEIGGCHSLGQDVQGALSLGRSSSRQELVFNGRGDVATTYGVVELLGKIAGTTLWPSAALLYQQGDADARRGYLNAGVQDFSTGRPEVETIALRLRVDWEDAARIGGTSFTPYADASYARSRIDAYTETGGGFPARFEERTEEATELRLGADLAHRLSATSKLLGRLEAAHRFEETGARTSGTVLGLFSFDLPAQRNKRDWLRAGAGVEAKLGPGIASAMLNGTTHGAVPSYWLNLSYQLTF